MDQDTQSSLPSWLVSSEGTGLSLRVKGYLLTIIPMVVIISKLLGHPLLEADLSTLSDSVVLILACAGTILGSVMSIAGWARRNFNKQQGLGTFRKVIPNQEA